MPTVLQNTTLTGSPQASQAQQIPTSGPFRNPLPVESFGVAPINPTAVAEGAGRIGQGISVFAEKMLAMQQRIDTTSAEEALVDFEREKNRLFFDPETGYFNTRGRDAYDAAEPFNKTIEELRTTHADQIQSPNARDMFVKAADSQVTRAQADVMRHASAQFDAWEAATINSRIENSIENAALYWNDPDQLAISMELGRQSVMDVAQIRGSSAETLAEDLQDFNSKFAVASIEGALANSASDAQRALAESKELLESPDLVSIQRKIDQQFKVEKNQADSQAAVIAATSLVDEHGDKPNARSLISEGVSAIGDPDLRQKTLRESMYQLDMKLKGDAERRGQAFEAGEEFILSGGSLEQFISQNPNAWDDLTSRQKRALQSGAIIVTDYAKLSELLLLPREELAKVNPAEHFASLAAADRQRLVNAVNQARTGTGGSQVGRTRTAETTSIAEQLFGERTTWGRKDKKRVDAFYAALTEEERFRVSQKGSELTSAEFTAMLADMTRTVVINRDKWFDKEMDISDVPSEDLGPITQELHRRGLPATADNIILMYQQASQ